jgi:hypothetical protein
LAQTSNIKQKQTPNLPVPARLCNSRQKRSVSGQAGGQVGVKLFFKIKQISFYS